MAKKVFLIILILIIPLYGYTQITPHLIHSDYGSNNQGPSQRIDITSGGRLWIIYNDNSGSDYVEAGYSDNDGVNWTLETTATLGFGTPRRNPSLFIDVNDTVHASCTRSTEADMPKYNKRNGSWGSAESVTNLASGPTYPQILLDSSGIAFCAFLINPLISATDRAGGSWAAKVDRSIDTGYTAKSLSCCMDDSDNMHCAWYAEDANQNFKFQTAYYNGTSWSSVTTFETSGPPDTYPSYTEPTINNVDDNLIVMWARYGVGTYPAKRQLRYSISTTLGSWSAATSATDDDWQHVQPDVCGGYGGDFYCVYSGLGIDPNNSGVYNLATIYYTGGAWTNSETLTYLSGNQLKTSLVNEGDTVHIFWTDTTNSKQYHGSFETTRYSPQMLIIKH